MADPSTAIKHATNAADARMVMMYPLVRVRPSPSAAVHVRSADRTTGLDARPEPSARGPPAQEESLLTLTGARIPELHGSVCFLPRACYERPYSGQTY
jgi:hypothetical protein